MSAAGTLYPGHTTPADGVLRAYVGLATDPTLYPGALVPADGVLRGAVPWNVAPSAGGAPSFQDGAFTASCALTPDVFGSLLASGAVTATCTLSVAGATTAISSGAATMACTLGASCVGYAADDLARYRLKLRRRTRRW